jgi:hypothetical protein
VRTDETPDAPPARTRRLPWLWIGLAAALVLAPAGWLGAEYAIDLEEMDAIRAQVDGVRELVERSASVPADAGESDACEQAGQRLATLASPPWWRHVAFTLLEQQQVEAAGRRLSDLRKIAAERRANRAWWTEQSSEIDAALALESRTVPDLYALRDRVESMQPPHPDAGGLAADARVALLARIESDATALTEAQDRVLQQFAAAAALVAQASDPASLDAALATAPGAGTRDLNPPELDLVRERLAERAEAIRAEFAFRTALEAAIARSMSEALALDAEAAAAADASAIVESIEAVVVPEGARYATLAESKTQALEAAQRRVALLEARDRDRAWLDEIAAAMPDALTARDSQALLERLGEDPPGGSELQSVAARAAELAGALRTRLQSRRDRSRLWRESLAAAIDAMIATRTLDDFSRATAAVDLALASGDDDPSSAEDAQAARAARTAQRATSERLVRAELAPVIAAASAVTDPRNLPPQLAAALSPDSPLASIAEAQETLDAIRARIDSRLAEHEAFDGAIDRARVCMERGDLCGAAMALSDAAPRTADQQWARNDLQTALGELAVETVEALVLGDGSLTSGTAGALERIVQCDALAACAPDAVQMARRVWADVRLDADRSLWEDCRNAARDALDRSDAATYLGALTRYIGSGGTMRDAAAAARDAFAVPVASVIASEFAWGASTCPPTDVLTDITITVDGDTWSGPIPTGAPRRLLRLSHGWTVRSGADLVTVSASGVCPCDDPQPFAGLGEIPLNDRRFGALMRIPCTPVGEDADEGPHELTMKVIPSPAWLALLKLPPWSAPEGAADDPAREDPASDAPPRPESDEPTTGEPASHAPATDAPATGGLPVTEPTPAAAP